MTYVTGSGCDDACNPSSGDWRDSQNAWQWTASYLGGLAAMAFAALGVRFGLTHRDDAMLGFGVLTTIGVIVAIALP
jgi:hypothetical protein